MTSTNQGIKCRELLGRLKNHGIQASRRTRVADTRDGPDALLVAEDGRTWLTVVWEGLSTQPNLGLEPNGEAATTLDEVTRHILEWRHHHQTGKTGTTPDIVILAPSLPPDEFPGHSWMVDGESVRLLSGRVLRKSDWLARALLSMPTPSLPQTAIDHWRASAVPEVRINLPRPRANRVREDEPDIALRLLDYKQERCARLDIEPAPAAMRTLANNLGLRIITGVAGCGKTLLLVHRARLLATHFPSARVLIVSHNRPLIRDVRHRVESSSCHGQINCLTFYQWLAGVMPSPGNLLKPHQIHQWIAAQRSGMDCASLKKFSNEWLAQEFDWMFAHDQAGESYLSAARKGRGTPLTTTQRREMLTLAQHYRAFLRSKQTSDWSEWPLLALEQNPPSLLQPQFDHLLIDEAQFFAPVWLRLLLLGLKPGGHLFLCADPTQGFLRRRLSWQELGLDVRQRSHRLDRPYRSTRAILEFARSFYQRRQPQDDEPLNLPSPEWIESIEPGTPPIVQPAGSHQDQITRLIREIRTLQERRIPLDDILIVAAGRDQFEKHIVNQLNAKLGPGTATLLKDDPPPHASIGVVHLMAATGLERPIVFLVGIDDLAADESNPLLTPEERLSKSFDHTRLIYVGLTRAMEKLVIYSSHPHLRTALGLAPD